MKRKRILMHALIWSLILFALSPLVAFSQDQPAERRFGREELDQMLAPIALYPDSLLAQILMAATYPLEVVQADRWIKANKNLQGDQLNDALDYQNWDPSVKALVPFPQVLAMMNERLEWTQKLGDAFLDQEDEVMDAVQELRARAQEAGNLRDTEQQRVIEDEGSIVIEPVQPEVVYVPVYDPFVIYGPWWYPAFPPFFFPPPPGVVIVRGFGFWPRIHVGRNWDHGWGHWDWRHHSVDVNINRQININRDINVTRSSIQTTRWRHDAFHRRGVSYRNESTQRRYGRLSRGVETRRDFRGFGQETRSRQAPVTTRQGPPGTRPQQAPVTTRQGLPETKSQQAPMATRQAPRETRTQQAPVTTRQGPPEAKSQQAPMATRQSPLGTKTQRAPVATRQGPDLSKERSAFGGLSRGSDVRIQSNRGQQSRQNMFSKGQGGTGQGGAGQGSPRPGNGTRGNMNKGDVGRGSAGRPR